LNTHLVLNEFGSRNMGNLFYMVILLVIALLLNSDLFSQEVIREQNPVLGDNTLIRKPDERRIVINTLSHLSFGAFYPGAFGGTISISKEGMRTATGSVVLFGSNVNTSPAVYEIRCPAYTMIHIMTDKQIVLKGHGNNNLICIPDIAEKSHSMVTPHNSENGFIFSIGAKLIIDGSKQISSGDYSGRISIFIVVE